MQPNSFNAALDSQKVLDDYAKACRHFGRPPTNAELGLFGRENSGFMGVNTLKRHFGGKEGIVSALRDRAIQRAEADLLRILPEAKAISPDTEGDNHKVVKEGSVYLMKSGGYYKVGRSDQIEKRVKQISIAMPESVELIHVILTDDAPGIEAYWHRRFSKKRANGEWFKLDAQDVRAFKRRKFQ